MRFYLFLVFFCLNFSALFSQDVFVAFEAKSSHNDKQSLMLLQFSLENKSDEEKSAFIKIDGNRQVVRQEIVLAPYTTHIESIPYWPNDSEYLRMNVKADNKDFHFTESTYSSNYGVLADNSLVLVVADEMKSLSHLLANKEYLQVGKNLSRSSYLNLPKTSLELSVYDLIVVDRLEFEKKHSQSKLLLQRYAGAGGKILFVNSDPSNKFEWEGKLLGAVFHEKQNAEQYINVDNALDSKPSLLSLCSSFLDTQGIVFSLDNNKFLYLISLGVFTLLAGLVNFYKLKRMNRMYLIYITLPVFSILFCFLILITYFFEEGSKKLHHGSSVTFLDPTHENATTLALTMAYHSFAGRGIEVPLQTFCRPEGNGGYGYRKNYFVDREEQQVLQGHYCSSRSTGSFFSYSQATTALSSKLLSSSDDVIEVQNGLPYDAVFYLVDATNKAYYFLDNEPVLPEKKVRLKLVHEKVAKQNLRFAFPDILVGYLKERQGRYLIARCTKSDFAPLGNDNSYESIQSKHFIVQRLD